MTINDSSNTNSQAMPSYGQDTVTSRLDVPVLVIGGGPAGLLQSYLLAKLGVETLVIERYPQRLGAPKAHALSPRSLEICRQFGLDLEHIRCLGAQRDDAYWVNFLTTLSGDVVGRLPYERMDVGVLDHTPEMIHNISQPDFEQYISEELFKLENVEVRKGVSFVSLKEQKDGVVTTTVEERSSGAHYTIRSKFAIACDGAKSKVRDYLEIESDGEDSYETMMTIHFSADLRTIVGERVGMLHWLFDPLASGFIIAYDLSGNAVLITNFDSEKYPPEAWNEALCHEFLTGAVGQRHSAKVLSYRPWVLSRRVAKSYRKGNVFLAGDAAHSFPPTGGLGLNSGLADVHNLAFKMAAVCKQEAGDSLLDSYDADRRHVAKVNSIQSVKNGKAIFGLLKALGTADIADVEEARHNLKAAINDPEQMKRVAIGVEEQREHFDNLNLHIGYVYGDDSIPTSASDFKPSFRPGARLPHAWLGDKVPSYVRAQLKPVNLSYVRELPEQELKTKMYSTLDLCVPNSWTVLLPSPIDTFDDGITRLSKPVGSLQLKSVKLGRDFDILSGSAGDAWLRDSGIQSGRGLVVRPDQHILCSFDCGTTKPEELADAISEFLGIR